MMPKVKGSHPWALILCNAKNQPVPSSPTLADFQNLIASLGGNGLYTWWQQISGGSLDLEGSTVFGWHQLSFVPSEIQTMKRGQLVAAAVAAAEAARDTAVSSFPHTLAVVVGCPDSGNTGTDIAAGVSQQLGFFAHESGHAFGLDHAYGTSRTGDIGNDRGPGAYGDWTDIMSWGNTAHFDVPVFTPAGAGLSAPTLNKLGWMSSTDVTSIIAPAAAQTVTITPLYGGAGGATPRMILVVEPTRGWIYTAEYRVPQNWDQGILHARVVVHAQRTLYQAGQDGWRWCGNCQGMIYAGQTVCPAGGVHAGRDSGDYWLSLSAGSGAGQTTWLWCCKCSGLFLGDNVNASRCPAGGVHDGSRSSNYALPSSGSGQSNWLLCSKCLGLFYGGSPSQGICAVGGLHTSDGKGTYVLANASDSKGQNKWRWCRKCQGLYFAGLGACKGGDVHSFGDDDFSLVRDLAGARGQAGWRYCSKCYGLAFNDGTRAVGSCAAGGTHDHSQSGHYVIPRDAEAEAGQRSWVVCRNCSALNFVDTTLGPGRCSGVVNGNHANGPTEYVLAHDTIAVEGGSDFHWCRNCGCLVQGTNPGNCSAGGNHQTIGSFYYVVRTDPASLIREQAYWSTCTKCSALFSLQPPAVPPAPTNLSCPGGQDHVPTGEYFVTLVMSDPFWRWCNKCEALAYWDGSPAPGPGPCPVSGSHDHSGSGHYIPPRFKQDVTQVVNDDLTAGGTWSDSSGRVTLEVTTMDANSATIRATAI